jgi:hypothetical protein
LCSRGRWWFPSHEPVANQSPDGPEVGLRPAGELAQCGHHGEVEAHQRGHGVAGQSEHLSEPAHCVPFRIFCQREPRGTAMEKVANRNVRDFGWEMSSRGRFATPADFSLHDCSPYSHVHVRRESLGFVHRSRPIFCQPVPNPKRHDSQLLHRCISKQKVATFREKNRRKRYQIQRIPRPPFESLN